MKASSIYVGIMTGTSHDAVDVSFISIDNDINLEYFFSKKIPKKIQSEIALIIENFNDKKQNSKMLDIKLGKLFSLAFKESLAKSNISSKNIKSIALSGQTILHLPDKKKPISVQIGNPSFIAFDSKIPVVHDFRKTHIDLGGEGAPLVPEFHMELFKRKNEKVCVLNIGGIANYTYIDKEYFWGTDTGPGNALMDVYCQNILNKQYDNEGNLASKGQIKTKELNKMLQNDFFKKPFPKSTGKEIFNLKFIPQTLVKDTKENVLATLCELTALTISKSIQDNKHDTSEIIVCGGGVKNLFLMNRISYHSKNKIISSEKKELNPQAIESMAFAWLGYKRVKKIPSIVQIKNKQNVKGMLGKIF